MRLINYMIASVSFNTRTDFPDPVSFDKGILGKASDIELHESGARLASR